MSKVKSQKLNAFVFRLSSFGSGPAPSLNFNRVVAATGKPVRKLLRYKSFVHDASKTHSNSRNCSAGFTLFETIVYVALLGVIVLVVINFLLSFIGMYQHSRQEREVVSNARLILETLEAGIAQAHEVYSPTSRFYTSLGQLSLITAEVTTTNHTTGYVDYFVDNGRFMVRREGKGVTPISASSVQVSQFNLEEIRQGLGRDSIRVTLGVRSSASPYGASTTLYSTTAIRGSY